MTPEDLILSKLDWARETGSELQERDVREILAGVEDLDSDYLETWATQLGLSDMLEKARER